MTNENPDPQSQGKDHQAIARRAHELFVARGSDHGHDAEDWLEAERELYPEGEPPAEQQTPAA